MSRKSFWAALALGSMVAGCTGVVGDGDGDGAGEPSSERPSVLSTVVHTRTFTNSFGRLQVFSTDAANGIDTSNPFFQNLGSNGRTCNSCHKLSNALGISVANINNIFNASLGLDPLFTINDGSN